MVAYLYTLVFGIFMTDIFRIPAPITLGLLMLPFVKKPLPPFAYYKECILFTIALFFYNIVGLNDYISFTANLITIVVCAFYFNYFVGSNKRRFNITVAMIYCLLLLSMVILVLDHYDPGSIDPIRAMMLGEAIKQSPAGLAITQFTFGYQIAAFAGFVFVLSYTFRQNIVVKILAFCICMTCLYLGMNRSAFISFSVASVTFLFIYYRFKAVFLVAAVVLMGFAIYTFVLKENADDKNNILAKDQAKEANDFNRANLAAENLKIYADYPYGLIFYGKNWDDVTYRNQVFGSGLTSHNAYLMFITYLGPFLGIGLLIGIYYKIIQLFLKTVNQTRLKSNALLLCLFFSFLSVSFNALSHNAWLVAADGPTLFLYFAILQGARIYEPEPEIVPVEEERTTVLV
ncbi:O-antigen ligase family protein [Mucilaginibacter sp. SP1R1]|uniref:O-antigen ligase family protein n=1 Tax=Mucilaginibacter sp. SP1R1 TaxID=2723091 RepID=UPI003B0059B0